jgi:hypothetical protein
VSRSKGGSKTPDDLKGALPWAVGSTGHNCPREFRRTCEHSAEWAEAENARNPFRRRPAVACSSFGRQHDICDAHRVDGQACTQYPRQYGTVCKVHGGETPGALKMTFRRQREAKAKHELKKFARAVDIDPQTALVETLQSKAGQVMYLRALVNNLDQDSLKQTDKTGSFEQPSVWVGMLRNAEADLVTVSKVMIDVGFSERQARYVDAQALLLVAGLQWMRRELGHGDDPAWDRVERAMLESLAGGRAPDGVAVAAIEGVVVDA